MPQIGYTLSSEEHSPNELVRFAQRAEQAGFTFALISDHFHPWTDAQGQSPFVWSVIGAVAAATRKLRLGTGVTCPTMRLHPAIVAHAAATAAAMMPGRFFLGVGTGENLNEHIVGRKWPPAAARRRMLEEAVGIIRSMWKGGTFSHEGRYYKVENARLYTLPDEAPPIYIAAGGGKSATLAGRIGDGLIGVGAGETVVSGFESAGGKGKPRFAQIAVCWARSESEARRTALRTWPISAFAAPLLSELALPQYFQEAAGMISEEDIAERVACGPDPEKHMAAIRKCIDAGFDHVYLHQIGKDQDGFFQFCEREILPQFGQSAFTAA